MSELPSRRVEAPRRWLAAYARVRPFAEAMFLVLAADAAQGSPAQRQRVRDVVESLSGGELSGARADALMTDLRTSLLAEGAQGRLDDVAARLWGDLEDRQFALELVVDLAQLESDLDRSQWQRVAELSERLGVNVDEVQLPSAAHCLRAG